MSFKEQVTNCYKCCGEERWGGGDEKGGKPTGLCSEDRMTCAMLKQAAQTFKGLTSKEIAEKCR